MNYQAKHIVFWMILIGVAALLWAVTQNKPNPVKATYSQFLQQVQAGQVSKVIIEAEHGTANPVTYSLKDGGRARTVLPWDYRDALGAMQQKMVNIEIRDPSMRWTRLVNAGPFLLLLGFWVFMMRRLQDKQAPR